MVMRTSMHSSIAKKLSNYPLWYPFSDPELYAGRSIVDDCRSSILLAFLGCFTHWAPSIKNAEDSSSESRSAESFEITRNNRTALNLSPSKPARSLQKKIWRRLRERLSRAARRLDEDSLEIHSPAVESIHLRWIDSTWFSSFIERPWIDSTHKIQRIQV